MMKVKYRHSAAESGGPAAFGGGAATILAAVPAATVLALLLVGPAVFGTSLTAQPSATEEGAYDTVRLSVTEAVERATMLNETVLMARAEQARIRGLEREVRARSLPDLSASFGYTRNLQQPVIFFDTPEGVQQIAIGDRNDYAFSLTFSQPLLDFSLGPARRAATLSRDATAWQVEAARTSVAFETRVAYYTVLLDRELVRVQEEALAQAESRLREVEVMYRAGTVSEFDLLTAQVEVENIRPQLIEARHELELDRSRLKRLLDVPMDARLVLTDTLGSPEGWEGEATLERALEARADVTAQRLTVELHRQSLAAERGAGLPSFDLLAGLTRRASSPEFLPRERDFSQSATAGFSVSLPLFDGRARSGRVQQAEAAVDRETFRLRQLRGDVELELQQARQALEAALERIEASGTNVGRAERALEIAQARFRTGVSSQIELNDAELAATRARTNFAQALYAYHVATARLDAALGER